MRHRVASKQFNRDTNHRKHLLRNLVRSLIEHGEITTTAAKAKETKRLADRLIGMAKTDSVAVRRQLHTFFGKRDVVSTLVEKIAPLMKKRASGFSKVSKLGKRRGDNVEMVKLSLVEQREVNHTLKSHVERPKRVKKPAKKAAKKATKKVVKPQSTKVTVQRDVKATQAARSTTKVTQRTTAKGK